MPRIQWQDTAALTKFALLIRDYMWNHRPPLNPNSFAEIVGVRSSTVAKWRDGALPDPETMDLIAERTGMSLLSLYEAAGYLTSRDVWEYLSQKIETSSEHDEDTRQRDARHIAEMRAQYDTQEQTASNDEACRAPSS